MINSGMNQLATIKLKDSLREMQKRHASETAKARQAREKRTQKCLIYLAHFLLYCKGNPQVLDNSVRYLFELSKKYQIPKILAPVFSLESLQRQLSTQQGCLYPSFFKKSLSILNEEVFKIVKTFRSQKMGINTQLDIKLEIFAYLWKFQRQLKLYMPTQEGTIRKIPAIGMLFNNNRSKLDSLRKFYDRYEQLIQFKPKQLGLQQLVSTYYILLLKKKFYQQKVRSKINQIKLKDVHKVMESINAVRQSQVNSIKNNEGGIKRLFCEHYRLKKTIKRAEHWESKLQDVEEIASIFEEFRILKQQPSINHPKIIYLEKQRGILTAKVLVKKYRRYQKQRKRQQRLYGENIFAFKIQLLTNYLRKNNKYTFQKWLAFIDRPFYEENIVEILKREAQYHQLVYINRVIDGIEMRKSQGTQIIFADYYNTASDEHSMKDQSQDYSIITAIGFNGSLFCRMFQGKMQEGLFLQEIANMFQENIQQSVFIFYDRKFPHSGWLKQQKIALLRKLNILVNLPFIKAVPNPSQRLCQQIWHIVKQKIDNDSRNKQNIQLYLEQAVKICQRTQIVQKLLNRQWQKAKDLTINETKSSVLNEKLDFMKKVESIQEHFGEKPSKNVQRKLFETKKQINEDHQISNAVDSLADQSNHNQRGKQIIKMENLESMKQGQLRQILPILTRLLIRIHLKNNLSLTPQIKCFSQTASR